MGQEHWFNRTASSGTPSLLPVPELRPPGYWLACAG